LTILITTLTFSKGKWVKKYTQGRSFYVVIQIIGALFSIYFLNNLIQCTLSLFCKNGIDTGSAKEELANSSFAIQKHRNTAFWGRSKLLVGRNK